MKNFKLIALALVFTMTGIHFIEAKGICKKGQKWNYKKAKCVDSNKKSSESNPGEKNSSESNLVDKAQELIDAINNQDAQATLILFVTGTHEYGYKYNKKLNLSLIQAALALTPDYSASVRCTASNPDCGISRARKSLLDLQTYLQGSEILNKSFIQKLFDKYFNSKQDEKKNNSHPIVARPPVGSNPATYAPRRFEPTEQFNENGLVGNYFNAIGVATIHDPSGKNSKQYNFTDVIEKSSYAIDKTAQEGLILFGSYMRSPKCGTGKMFAQVMTNTYLYGKLQSTDSSAAQAVEEKETNKREPIADDQFFHVGDEDYSQPVRAIRAPNNKYGRPVQGIIAPEDDRYGRPTRAPQNIYNTTNQDVALSLFNDKVTTKITMTPQQNMNLPKRFLYLQLTEFGKPIKIMPDKSYSIIVDDEGNLSIKTHQIYY